MSGKPICAGSGLSSRVTVISVIATSMMSLLTDADALPPLAEMAEASTSLRVVFVGCTTTTKLLVPLGGIGSPVHVAIRLIEPGVNVHLPLSDGAIGISSAGKTNVTVGLDAFTFPVFITAAV